MHRYREISFTCAFRASLIFCPALSDRHETPVLFRLSFALCSLLFDLCRFNARWIFHRAAGGWSSTSWSDSLSGDTRTACRLCTVSSLVSSAFENALFSATKTSDRYSFLPRSIRCHRLQRYHDAQTFAFHNFIKNAQLDTLIVWRKFQFCINLVATRKSLRAWQFRPRSWFYFRHVRH